MAQAEETQELDLRRYLAALRRRRGLLAAIVVGMVGAVVALSLAQAPRYEGKTQLLVQPQQAESLFTPDLRGPAVDPELTISTAVQLLKSDPIQEAVTQRLGPVPDVQASRVGKTFIIDVRARSTEPRRAAMISDAYAEAYIEFRRKQASDDLLAAAGELTRKTADVQGELDELNTRVNDAPAAQRDALRASLEPRRIALAAQLTSFQERLDEVEVQAALATGGAQIAARAPVPDDSVTPTPVRDGILALIVALLLGLTLICVLEFLDDSITDRDDLVEAIGDLPVLGSIPVVSSWRKHGSQLLVSGGQEESLAAEAYRALRTSVQMLGVERPLAVIQVTSAFGSEGKSATVANLAAVLAQLGQRVVVVDCDLRRPRIRTIFDIAGDEGLTSVLARTATLDSALQRVTVNNAPLAVLPSGPIPPNPSELLASKRMAELIFQLQSDFDVVLLDSPPVLAVTDSTALSSWVDAVVVVAAAGIVAKKPLRSAIDTLHQVGAPVAGVVFNRTTAADQYGYGYGDTPGERQKGSGRRRRA